jgi:serine/threonine protein kinase
MEITASVPLVGALPPGTELHEYRIERVLGHGGFGITYLARDVNLDKKVAIKEYLPNDLATRGEGLTVALRTPDSGEHFRWGMESFIKEARVLGKFAHESLAQVHRYFEANRTAYFVMEYVEGATLARVLKREGTINEDRLRKILFPLLDGLEEVHRLGVLHRDIKPDNIILRADAAAPVLIDFGAARQNLSSMTRSVMSVLTAGYAPIEQYATSGNQGPWTDLYAMGAVAYRALSGKRPIDAVNRIRDDPLVPAAEVGRDRYTPHFLAAVDWALAVNGEDRPQSVGDFKRALDGKMSPPRRRLRLAPARTTGGARRGSRGPDSARRQRCSWPRRCTSRSGASRGARAFRSRARRRRMPSRPRRRKPPRLRRRRPARRRSPPRHPRRNRRLRPRRRPR